MPSRGCARQRKDQLTPPVANPQRSVASGFASFRLEQSRLGRLAMRTATSLCFIAASFVAAAIPAVTAAQEQQDHKQHHHYILIDLGTLGGPTAYRSINAPGYQIINNSGVIAFAADTTAADPIASNPSSVTDCSVVHAARWKKSKVEDLGALLGNR